MLIKQRRGWEMPEGWATLEAVFLSRRAVVGGGLGLLAGVAVGPPAWAEPSADAAIGLYPARRSEAFQLDRSITAEKFSADYNNFYEFGSSKSVAATAQTLKTRPWTIAVDGLVERPFQIGFDDLLKKVALEERLYRHRCVEAWAMAVPWTGFPMRALLDLAKPLGSAKYVKMQSFQDRSAAPGQRQTWYPWPYTEGLTIPEAAHELAFLVTGVYGKPLPKQFGAPLRLAVPWKYGFKSAKSLVRFSFVEERPKSFWEALQPSEYGFWANVNPEVPHPRWSQAQERLLGTTEMRPTLIYNGYGEFVASLYGGFDPVKERLFI